MKKRLQYTLMVCIFIIAACQKGIHWDLASEGVLLKDSAGNCLPVIINGTFITHKQTSDSNFITANVNVTAAGTYTITSDSVNGYIFRASGIFKNTGVIQVKLLSSGTPLILGKNHFSIYYNNSQCETDVTVLSDSIPLSDYTLQGSPANCMNDTISGSYLQTILLDTSNKIKISVNVITPGYYSISTDTVNGCSFSGSGIFTTSGIQSVTINGSGIPTNTGNNLFTVNANNSTCDFLINVLAVAQTNGQLHFPLTAGSYWTYVDPFLNDTTKRYVNGDSLINNIAYVKVSELKSFNPQTYFYNYKGGEYNEFGEVEKYNSSFAYSPGIYGLIPFLKESLSKGTSWESETFRGTASFGQVLYFKYGYYCSADNATKVVNGLGFKNVYIIDVYPQLKSEGNSWGNTNEVYHCYYALGIGLISIEENLNSGDVHPVLQIIDWKVN